MKTGDQMKAKSLEIVMGMAKDGFAPHEAMTVLAMTLAIMAKTKGLSHHQIVDNFITSLKAVSEELK